MRWFRHKHKYKKTSSLFVNDGTIHFKLACESCDKEKWVTLEEITGAIGRWAEDGPSPWKVIGNATLVYNPNSGVNPKDWEEYL